METRRSGRCRTIAGSQARERQRPRRTGALFAEPSVFVDRETKIRSKTLYQTFHARLSSFHFSGTKASFRRLTQMRGCWACSPGRTAIMLVRMSRLWALAGPVRTHNVLHAFYRTHLTFVSLVPGRRSRPSITDVWFIRAKSALGEIVWSCFPPHSWLQTVSAYAMVFSQSRYCDAGCEALRKTTVSFVL